MGLLTAVARSGNYRIYTDTHVLLIQLIVKAKTLGFKLAELKQVVAGANVQEPWQQVLQMIDEKQQSLAAEIQVKQEQLQTLSEYTAQIQRCLSANPNCQLEEGLDSPLKGRL